MQTAAPLIPAATALLLRDAPGGIEVLMVSRADRLDIAGGTWVFPGGKVEDADRPGAIRDGPACLTAFAIAACRETFEEVGLLLAVDRSGVPVAPAVAQALAARHREAVAAAPAAFGTLLTDAGLRPDLSGLLAFARWHTPSRLPKRFDTVFFLAAAPAGQAPTHDGTEHTDSRWVRPHDLLAAADRHEAAVVFPTRRHLEWIALHADLAAAFAAARGRPMPLIEPHIVQAKDGRRLAIPAEAGYPVTSEPLSRLMAGG